MATNNAKMIDLDVIWEMGFDPKTGLPRKVSKEGSNIRNKVLRQLRIKDEQEFVNSISVYTPGLNMSSQEFMRMMYYYPNLAIFVLNGSPYLMPYALDGGLDFYNRPNYIHPVPLTQGSNDINSEQKKALNEVLKGFKKKVVYECMSPDEIEADKLDQYAIIVKDYTPQRSLNNTSRAEIDDALLAYEADLFQYMRTSAMMGSGVRGVRVSDPDGTEAVISASNAIDTAALSGQAFIPILSRQDFQDLSQTGSYSSQDYMLAIQGIDNFRKQCLGVDNAAMFDKSQYVNKTQSESGLTNNYTLLDRLNQLLNSLMIFNSIWGTDWYAEMVTDPVDMNDNLDDDKEGDDNVNDTGNEQQDVQ